MLVRSLVGAFALGVAFGPQVIGARALRRKLLPGWDGPPGWVVELVVVMTTSLLVVTGLGVLGWFAPLPTTLLLAAAGGALVMCARRLGVRVARPATRRPERLGRPAQVVAVVALACVVATWGARTYVALNHGMVSIDSLWYHLPQAARMAHSHSITGIHHDVDGLSGFYPINAELVHSVGMSLLGSDLLSMVINAGWGVVAVVAAWCIGRAHGTAAVCVTAVCVLLCTPAFVGTQPGAAHNDIVGVALVLVTAAILVTADPRRLTRDPLVLALAAMPVGFAVGTKWTLVPIAAAVTLGVIVLLPRGRRLWGSAQWLVIVGSLGAFSYVRNLVKAGSPLPSIDLKLGPLGWNRQVPEIAGMASVSQFLFDGDAWHTWLLPGLSEWFGYAWWAVLALVAAGVVLSIVTGPGSLTRMLGVVAAVALVGYLVQPQLLTLYDQPYFFAANLRYVAAPVALALVLLPLSPVFHRRGLAWAVPIVCLAIVAVMQLDSAVWPLDLRDLRWEEPVQGADAVAGVVMGIVALVVGLLWLFVGRARWRDRRRPPGTSAAPPGHRRALAFAAALVVLLLGTIALDRFYLAHRYARPEAATPFLPRHWQTWEWARDVHDERIAFKAPSLSYPLYGNRLSNVVEPLPGDPSTGGGDEPETCAQFVRRVNDRRYTYVVLFGNLAPADLPEGAPSFEQIVPEVGWLESDPNATRVLDAPLEAVFRVDGPLDPGRCA